MCLHDCAMPGAGAQLFILWYRNRSNTSANLFNQLSNFSQVVEEPAHIIMSHIRMPSMEGEIFDS